MKITRYFLLLIIFLSFVPFSSAKSLIFYESFDNITSIQNNLGISSGYYSDVDNTPLFFNGIKGNAANFSGYKKVCYPLAGNFNESNGTIQFLVKSRPNNGPPGCSGDCGSTGTFFDIGGLGAPNSWGRNLTFVAGMFLMYSPLSLLSSE